MRLRQPFKQFNNRVGRRGHRLLFLALLIMLLPLFSARAAQTEAADLTLTGRLSCQLAVEEIYWENRLWPAENPGPKPEFSAVVSPADIQAKVEDALRRSNALADVWQQEITGAMLQAEINRMAQHTQQPEILAAIWSALDNDPVLVAECLARPALANRLLRNFYTGTAAEQDLSFDAWWAANRDRYAPELVAPVYTYTLPAISDRPVTEGQPESGEGNFWESTPAIPIYTDGRTVWTGSEMLYFGGSGSNQGYRYDPATDTWDQMNLFEAPVGRREHTAVWTGTEMIVWGGCTGSTHACDMDSGGRYDPVTNVWTPTSEPGDVSPRTRHTAVWTGEVMVIWGGCSFRGTDFCTYNPPEGGRYDPTTDTWQTTTTVGAPEGRVDPRSVWTGDEMIIWSSASFPGGRYDPVADSWQSISSVNAPPGTLGSLVWTGTEAIAFGGCTGSPVCQTPENTGGRYNPVSDTWIPTSTTNAPAGRWFHGAVWTGEEMIVFGGSNGPDYFNTGGRYNPATDNWTATSTENAPSKRYDLRPVWTGELMIIWGGDVSSRTGGRYSPATDSWTPMSENDPEANRARHGAVWTGTEMIIWGGEVGVQHYDFGSVYDSVLDLWWLTTPSDDAPFGYTSPSAVWSGVEMLVWGGNGSNFVNSGGRYNPATDTWTMMTFTNAPEGRVNHAEVWSGTELIIWGGSTWFDETDNTGGRYNPATDTWTALSLSNVPEGRRWHTAVWTGDEMIVWGGRGPAGELNSGGRYDPASNSWTPVTTSGAPSPRELQSAVWSGSEMIIWGGGLQDSGQAVYNDGGRYDPVTNSWTPTSLTNAPEGRIQQKTVWSGEEMIIWGGCAGSVFCVFETSATGGRYNPATDSWEATTMFHAPEARYAHSAVWTGSSMIVWGGIAQESGFAHTGGLYYPTEPDNSAPLASNDSFETDQNVTLNVPAPGVLENDSDPDGDPLTAFLVSPPEDGVLTLNPDGSFTYIPDPDFAGTDAFTYRANDGMVNSNIATVMIAVNEEPNSAPTAGNDSFSAVKNETLSVPAPGVLENDSDPDGDALTAVLVSSTTNGVLELNSDGSFTYTPDTDFVGADTFTYEANDGLTNSNEATVTIVVNETPNNAPVAFDDDYVMQQDEMLVVAAPGLLANDSDPDGDPLSAALDNGPANGSVTVNADGSFTYTPDAGFNGMDTFTYLVDDGRGGVDTATVTITVNPLEVEHLMFLPAIQN